MDSFMQMMRNLGPTRLAAMGGVFLFLVAATIWFISRMATPQYEMLYGELDNGDAARMAQFLETTGVPYQVRDDGASIFVPADEVGPARMAMASEGMPTGGSMGYEIFDNSDSLGTTNFMQNVNLVRALEGELGRTITSIDAVKTARVHLVMPRRELFSRERQQPSASIVLQMRGSNRLSPQQVSAIQHLVASAVPSLTPNRISIVDGNGTLLARGFEDTDDPGTISAKADERRQRYENRLARTIEQLLEQTVGFGKVRAEVTADMDFDRVNTAEELFDPDGQVVRSTQTIEETASASEGEGPPPVSVATNLPDANLGDAGASSATTAESRTEETVNFEISKRVVNHVRDAGIINRLSVAVLVDGKYETGEDGESVYLDRSEAEMQLLTQLVQGAIGFDAGRGDSVDVINMRFAAAPSPAEEDLQLFFGLEHRDLLRVAELLIVGIVGILVILLVVRPLLTKAFEAMPVAIGGDGQLLADHGTPALTGPGAIAGVPVPGDRGGADDDADEMIDLDRVEGRVKASSVKKVGEIVDKHPEEAISIIRSWLYAEA